MPTWFRALVAAELAGLVVVLVLVVRLVTSGLPSAGPVRPLGTEHFPQARQPVATPAIPSGTVSLPSFGDPLRNLLPGLLDRLDRATASMVRAQSTLVGDLERAAVDRLRRLLDGLSTRGP